MSENQECPTCHANPCSCTGKQGGIKVNVSLSKEFKDLQQRNFELQEQLKQASLMQFETEKEQLKKEFPDAADLIDDPKTATALESLRDGMYAVKPSEKKITPMPTGKAPFTPPGNSEEYASQVEMIDKLYDAAYYHKEAYTPEQMKNAKKKVETLLESAVNGPSWRELGKRGTKEILQHELGECPECHYTKIDSEKCPNCGYDPTEKKRISKTRIFAPTQEAKK